MAGAAACPRRGWPGCVPDRGRERVVARPLRREGPCSASGCCRVPNLCCGRGVPVLRRGRRRAVRHLGRNTAGGAAGHAVDPPQVALTRVRTRALKARDRTGVFRRHRRVRPRVLVAGFREWRETVRDSRTPGSRTQNYFPTFDNLRLSTKSAAELSLSCAFARLPSRAGECRDWTFCGLIADWLRTWLRTRVVCVPALSPSRDTAAAPHPDQRAAYGGGDPSGPTPEDSSAGSASPWRP
jgi:hypothetical protein